MVSSNLPFWCLGRIDRKIRHRFIFLLLATACCSTFSYSQQEPSKPSFEFEVVETNISGCCNIGTRDVYVFLAKELFVRPKLEELFRYFSEKYPDRSIGVTAFSDKEMLVKYIAAEKDGIPDYLDTPLGRRSREKYIKEHYPPETGYMRAIYHRNEREEYYECSLSLEGGGRAIVTLNKELPTDPVAGNLVDFVKQGYFKGVRWAVEHKLDPNERDSYKVPAIIWAIILDHHEIAKYLIDNGADVNILSPENSPVIIFAAKYDNYVGIRMLVEGRANVNATTQDGKTALMVAAGNCNADMVRYLLDNKADPAIKDADGKTVKDYSCKDEKVYRLLR